MGNDRDQQLCDWWIKRMIQNAAKGLVQQALQRSADASELRALVPENLGERPPARMDQG